MVAMTLKEALQVANDNVAIASLISSVLTAKAIPMPENCWKSANVSTSLPDDLKKVPFLSKPVVPSRLVSLAWSLIGNWYDGDGHPA